MQQKQEKQPSQTGTGATKNRPMRNKHGKVLLPGASRRDFLKPYDFDKKKKKFEALGKLDLEDFNSAAEMTQFLDWYNLTQEESNKRYYENEIVEISKLLARLQTRKYIRVKDDK